MKYICPTLQQNASMELTHQYQKRAIILHYQVGQKHSLSVMDKKIYFLLRKQRNKQTNKQTANKQQHYGDEAWATPPISKHFLGNHYQINRTHVQHNPNSTIAKECNIIDWL